MKLTPARRAGLEVIADKHPGAARESNVTSRRSGLVYWQTARWLVANDLAYYPSGSISLCLTNAGVDLAREEQLL